jgi:Uma2 family endonuclease
MATPTKLTFEKFLRLPDDDKTYELSEGELLVPPSPLPSHNIARRRLTQALNSFVESNKLGLVLDGTHFRLNANTVRRPDVAFLSVEQLKNFNFDRSPVDDPPTLAIEVISAGDSAQDMLLKVHQYRASGSSAVWVFYPALALAVVYDANGTREVHGMLHENALFEARTFSLSLAEIFDPDYTHYLS